MNMKESVLKGFCVIRLIISLLVVDTSLGDPRAQLVNQTCSQQLANNVSLYTSNFVRSMYDIRFRIQSFKSGTASTGTGPDSSYGLAECYGDLSLKDCALCYAEARTVLPSCFPNNGGQVFLDGCFMRTENYSFYQEYAGPRDTAICGNTTGSRSFRDSVRQAISDAVRDAPRNKDYFTRKQALSETADESAYVLADCWNSLNDSSCTECLESAFASILKCFPFSEGRALHTGCILKYSNTNFLNPEQTKSDNGGKNEKYQVIQQSCRDNIETTPTLIPRFVQAMENVSAKVKDSNFGTAVVRNETNLTYAVAQCFGDIPTGDCLLCYAIGRTSLPSCLPNTGGRVYLNGCVLRYENYSFFGEYTGEEDRRICPNNTRRNNAFEQSVRMAVSLAVETAPKSYKYHARMQVLVSETDNELVYAEADCLRTLDVGSCEKCLQKAAKSMLECLPGSEGNALFTGCFMRYSYSSPSYPHHNRLSKVKILAIVMAVSSIVALLLAFYAWKQKSRSKRNGNELLDMLNSSSLNFKYSTIEKATSSFNEANKLGQGGFGTVYKGVLPNGREVAVKRLFFNHRHRAGDFYNEVNIISCVDHKNLVKLVGFSCLGPESILIYEYLPNKSLNHFIFDAVKGKELDWGKRYDIIVGIAEGLAYLHENSKTRIIHRDIKAANILLDSRLRAKIADFGLARSFQQDKNHISTGIAGTLGYMAPEYIAYGKLSEKVDVYGYGVLLLEIVTGVPNRGMRTTKDTGNLVSIAWEHFQQGSVEKLFDQNLMLNNQTGSTIKKEIERVVHIGLLCVQEVASLRPTMSMALQMLSKNIQPLPLPANPPYVPDTSMQLNECVPLNSQGVNNPASLPTVSTASFIPR